MMDSERLLPTLPPKLRKELLDEFQELMDNFYQGRWRASGLNAGRFCEVAYCVIKGRSLDQYPDHTTKPSDFRAACKALENLSSLPRSFRYIIPQVLTSLFEVRNNRNIGHVGGEVDPSFMDGSFVVANAKWILAEFIREYHSVSESKAQSFVNALSQYVSPLVWSDENVRRVLDTAMVLEDKILVLLASAGGRASRTEVFRWLDQGSRSTFNRRIMDLHARRFLEAKAYGSDLLLLPAGIARAGTVGVVDLLLAA